MITKAIGSMGFGKAEVAFMVNKVLKSVMNGPTRQRIGIDQIQD